MFFKIKSGNSEQCFSSSLQKIDEAYSYIMYEMVNHTIKCNEDQSIHLLVSIPAKYRHIFNLLFYLSIIFCSNLNFLKVLLFVSSIPPSGIIFCLLIIFVYLSIPLSLNICLVWDTFSYLTCQRRWVLTSWSQVVGLLNLSGTLTISGTNECHPIPRNSSGDWGIDYTLGFFLNSQEISMCSSGLRTTDPKLNNHP